MELCPAGRSETLHLEPKVKIDEYKEEVLEKKSTMLRGIFPRDYALPYGRKWFQGDAR
jgi:hypothetical protein